MLPRPLVAFLLVLVLVLDLLAVVAVQNQLANLLGQIFPRHTGVELVVLRERRDHHPVERAVRIPAADRAAGQR